MHFCAYSWAKISETVMENATLELGFLFWKKLTYAESSPILLRILLMIKLTHQRNMSIYRACEDAKK